MSIYIVTILLCLFLLKLAGGTQSARYTMPSAAVCISREEIEKRSIQQRQTGFQKILPDDNTDKLHPALMGMHPTQTEAETDDRIDHRVPNLARDGAAGNHHPGGT